MSQNNKHKITPKKKKSKLLLWVGIILFTLGLIQVTIFTYLFTHKPSHNSININGDTKTSEVCGSWYDIPEVERDTMISYTYEFYEGDMQLNKKTAIIPRAIIDEVCPKWLKVKEDIDRK